ncbi:MAG: hypothetical protein Q8Q33_08130, partial [Chlamydiota bacterium]|nr:hypothetical protein [Chlamydiota bacterium]
IVELINGEKYEYEFFNMAIMMFYSNDEKIRRLFCFLARLDREEEKRRTVPDNNMNKGKILKFPKINKNDDVSTDIFSKYEQGDAWLFFRMDCIITKEPADVCILMDIASGYLFEFVIILDEKPSSDEIEKLMRKAYEKQRSWPDIFYCPQNDPAKDMFAKIAVEKGIFFKSAPASVFYKITDPLKESFNDHLAPPESEAQRDKMKDVSEEDRIMARHLVPDAYDPCPCASGKKFKFCCKPIFPEIVDAMVSAEEGKTKEALEYMDKAKAKAGETPEILCRYAIVYAHADRQKYCEYRDKCLALDPNHPRVNYLLGIDFKEKGDYKGALKAYKIAAQNYPSGDRFHLNEVWNNIGTVYYELRDYRHAREAWEMAVYYIPEDKLARDNLEQLIYDIPQVLKKKKRNANRKK